MNYHWIALYSSADKHSFFRVSKVFCKDGIISTRMSSGDPENGSKDTVAKWTVNEKG